MKQTPSQKLCPACLKPYTERKSLPAGGRYRHWEDGKVRWCKFVVTKKITL